VYFRLESDVEDKVVAAANRMGILHAKLNLSGRRGWPDRVFLFPGRHALFIEFKRPGKKTVDKLQEYIHGQLRKLGFTVLVVNTVPDGIAALRQAVESASLST
jgi:hypothetical protein